MGTEANSGVPNGQAPEGNQNTPGQAPGNTPPITSAGANGQAPGSQTPPATSDELDGIPPERLKELLTAARSEAAKHRVAANELTRLKAAQELAGKTELEQAQLTLKATTTKYEALAARLSTQAVTDEARKLGMSNPELAYDLISTGKYGAIEVDDTGLPSNASELIRKLIQAVPSLATTQNIAGSPTNSASPTSANGTPANEQWFNESQLQDVDFYRKNKPAIYAAIRAGRIRRGV